MRIYTRHADGTLSWHEQDGDDLTLTDAGYTTDGIDYPLRGWPDSALLTYSREGDSILVGADSI